jgi:hypothetical protein
MGYDWSYNRSSTIFSALSDSIQTNFTGLRQSFQPYRTRYKQTLPVLDNPSHIGTCFPTAHVFSRHMCSHGLPWHMFSPGTRFNVTYFPVAHVLTGTCFPLAYVFPRHMFSRGTCVPAVSRGTCIPSAHVSPRHILSQGTCFPVTLVTYETNTKKKHCFTV